MVVESTANIPGESEMPNRTDRQHRRSITTVAALLAVGLMAAAAAPAAAQGTPAQRAACENDAMRLCGNYAPDVQRITACMHAKRSQLSPRCRAHFGGAKKKAKAGTDG
jgi:hypothetical protein